MRKVSIFLVFAFAFAFLSAFSLVGMQDAKAEGSSYNDLLKRIEALEQSSNGNVSAPKITGLNIGFDIRHRFEAYDDRITGGSLAPGALVIGGAQAGRRVIAAQPSTAQLMAAGSAGPGYREDDTFVLQRVRLTLDANVNKNVRALIKLQDSRTWGSEGAVALGAAPTVQNEARTDLLEGYVELRNLGDLNSWLSDVELRIGRWQMYYGNQRLIGHLNWANEGRSYDTARLRWDNKKNAWIDVFASMIEEEAPYGGASGDEDGFGNIDEVLYGVYSQFKVYPGNVFEPYFLVRARTAENTQPAAATGSTGEQRYTAGFRLDGRKIPGLGGFDYTIEPAWQFGHVEGIRAGDYSIKSAGFQSNESNTIQAFAIYAGVGYRFNNCPWTPRIGYAFVHASGDESPNRGAAKTFDHLYPTGHAQLGYMDYAAWQNIEDHQIHLNVKPTKKLVIDVKVHFLELDEEADRWYGVAGGLGYGGAMHTIRQGADLYTSPNGLLRNVDDDLGEEVDVTLKYKLFSNFGIVLGYSHFFTGDFIEDTAGGSPAQDEDSDWVYLQTTVKF